MNEILKKYKKIFILASIVLPCGLVFAIMQTNLLKVEAQSLPVKVYTKHLDFGTVFPGEERQGTFTVEYAEIGDGVRYSIVQKRKPLPDDHPEYPDGGDPDMPGYYRNLCPFLSKISNEGEGDSEEEAFVGSGYDMLDVWTIYFQVPAIFNFEAQDHIGGVVDASGEYGCDVSIEIWEEPGRVCGYKFADIDQNGEFYLDDYGLPNWTINIWKNTDCTQGGECDNGWEVVYSTTTDENGHYCFNEVSPGTYRIKEVLQPGWQATIPVNPGYFEFTIASLEYKPFYFGNYEIIE